MARYTKGLILFLAILLSLPTLTYAAKKRPYHLLAWESKKAWKYNKYKVKPITSTLKIKAAKRHVVKLKKTTFFNSMPMQFSSPLVIDHKVYVGVDSGHFYAIDSTKGKKIWDIKLDGPVHAKAAMDGYVYVGTSKGVAYALEAETGKTVWRVELNSEVLAAPLVKGDRVYFFTLSGRLFALDRMSGVEFWHTESESKMSGFTIYKSSSPVYVNGKILVGTSDGVLVAFDEMGRTLWRNELSSGDAEFYDIDSDALILNGKIFISSSDGNIYALDDKNGEVIWSSEGGGPNQVIYAFDRLYGGGARTITAVNPSDGSLIWSYDMDVEGVSAPKAGTNFLAAVSTKGRLFLMDPHNGDIVFIKSMYGGAFSDPEVIGDEIFLLSNTGRLIIYKVKKRIS